MSMMKVFDLLANLPEDMLAEREDSPPQERTDDLAQDNRPTDMESNFSNEL